MKYLRFLAPLAIVAWLFACSPYSETPNGAPIVRTAVSNDIDVLSRYITLPVRPSKASWETLALSSSGVPGPTDWYLMAELTYTKEQATALVRRFSSTSEAGVLDAAERRPWFSSKLAANWQKDGPHYRSAGPTYAAKPFYKNSLHDGYVVVLPESGKLFVYLQCCTTSDAK